jgi:hypothetical protein
MHPLHTPPCSYDEQAILSALAQYLPSRAKTPYPHLISPPWVLPTSTCISTPTHMHCLCPPPCSYDGQAISTMLPQYLPSRAKTPYPRLISPPWSLPTSAYISTPTYMHPLCPPPCSYNGQAISSVLAQYLPFGAKTPYPHPISPPCALPTSAYISTPTYMHPLRLPPRSYDGQVILSALTQYLPFGAKTPYPHPISPPQALPTSTCTSTLTHMLSLHPPPHSYDGQVILSVLARYPPIGGQNSPPLPDLSTAASS